MNWFEKLVAYFIGTDKYVPPGSGYQPQGGGVPPTTALDQPTSVQPPTLVVPMAPVPVIAIGDPAPMSNIPQIGIDLIQDFEKCAKILPNGMIVPYLDSGRPPVPTIGWGNTRWEDGRAVSMRDEPITQARADKLFAFFLPKYMAAVDGAVPKGCSDLVRATWLSFAWNVGIAGMSNSTATRRLRAGDIEGALEALLWWNQDGGKVVRGLQIRRWAEKLVAEGLGVKDARKAAEAKYPRQK